MKTIERCRELVQSVYAKMDASHDFDHIERVLMNAEAILATEPSANADIVRLAVYLHDVSDAKYAEDLSAQQTIIEQLSLTAEERAHIESVIEAVSFNGGNSTPATTIEAKIVRDADRLDALGAIGIARTFAYGGAKGRKLYDDKEEARLKMTSDEYRTKETASVTHFYEKLLLLKDLMLTTKGRELAQSRHAYMEQFLAQLQREKSGLL